MAPLIASPIQNSNHFVGGIDKNPITPLSRC
jgi:hypothetical protein